MTTRSSANGAIDGVKLAILNNRWEAVARKMANTLLRTGRSGVLATARDFSCCIVTADNRLLATAESIPIHVLVGPDMMAKSMCEMHPDIKPGDAFLHNSPYHGCSHPADLSALIPVFDEDGRHRYTAIVKAHQADIGNSIPTTYFGHAKDVYNEGALIFPAVQVQRDYKDIDDIIRICKMRIRVPEQWWGDYLGMMGAGRIAEREIHAIGQEFGWDELAELGEQWFAYSDERMRKAISKLPKKTATSSSTHDPLPGTPEEGVKINATVAIDPDEGYIDIDLTDNIDALELGINVSEACTRTAALIGVFNSIDHTVPRNAGSFGRVRLKLREGAVVGVPQHPTSCSVATTNVADRVSNAVQTAIAGIDRRFGQAETGALSPATMAVISGKDPRKGRPFVNQIFLGATAGAGTPTQDSWMTIAHAGNAGMLYIDSIEILEMAYPIRCYQRRLVTDSEGAGEFTGAPSLMGEYGPAGCEMEVNAVSDGTINAAKGVAGGGSAAGARQYVVRADGTKDEQPVVVSVRISPDERILSYSAGGGGFGAPRERAPEKVVADLREGLITAERARDVYGVVVTSALELDAAATKAARAG
ncbi:hydantoinase B/oxoprolinase family protein [Salipiger thiooxidans]|uniref:hydantoinase B/oxoprolinase family protein n=1 Tax=Salipiger thiooxidans TaxID=282683 RepID=UPI001CD622F5|nr:hydantoinase B/oxoprolinase family protein [Salipiger thiooxidans]MCA0851327.1 hydantoinase B/oxoprolinase family protein [Salipiger thiooxidans]